MLAWSLRTLLRESDNIRERSLVSDAYVTGLADAARLVATDTGIEPADAGRLARAIEGLALPREHEVTCYYLRSSDQDGDEAARCTCQGSPL